LLTQPSDCPAGAMKQPFAHDDVVVVFTLSREVPQ
jgi:hypothetical protein